MALDSDKYLSMLGRFSRWQLYVYTLLSITIWLPTCWQMLTVVFVAAVPKYHCIPTAFSETEDNKTVTVTSEPLQCEQMEGNSTQPCTNGFWHDPAIHSVHTEWDLYCNLEPIGFSLSQSVYQVTMIIGVLICSPLSDRYGRKKVHLLSLMMMSIAGLLTAFSPNIWLFIVGRGLTGLFREGTAYAGVVAAAELFPTAQRSFAGTAHEISWGVGMVTLAGLAVLLNNWRHLQIALSVIPLIFVSYFWLLPESLCWLLANNKKREAKEILVRAFKFNKMPVPDEVENMDQEETVINLLDKDKHLMVDEVDYKIGQQPQNYTVLDMFRSKTLTINTVAMCFVWFVTTMVYYGLSLSTGTLAGNRYLNFLLSGLSEIIGFIIIIFVAPYFGRKKPMVVCCTLAGLCLGVIPFLPKGISHWYEIILSNLGKVFITGNFAIIIAYVPELYPTNLRSVGVSFSVMFGRIGGILSPYYYLVSKQIPWLPMALSALLAFCCAAVSFVLPETLRRTLPLTIEEVESWDADKCSCIIRKSRREASNSQDDKPRSRSAL